MSVFSLGARRGKGEGGARREEERKGRGRRCFSFLLFLSSAVVGVASEKVQERDIERAFRFDDVVGRKTKVSIAPLSHGLSLLFSSFPMARGGPRLVIWC